MVGLAVLVLGFAVGSEPATVPVNDQAYACASVIPTSWFTSDDGSNSTATPPPRRLEPRCDRVELRSRLLTWGALGIGGLLVLTGWTVVREDDDPQAPRVERGSAQTTG